MGRKAMILLALGAGMLVIGALFRIQHWPFAGALTTISYVLSAIGAVLFIAAVVKNKRLTGAIDPDHDQKDPD